MTLLLGLSGFGEAPTRAIVCVSARISAGVRIALPGYPEPMADRLRVACVQLNATDTKAENIERAEGLVAQRRRDRRRPGRPPGEMDGHRPARRSCARPGREPRGRRDRRGHERLGADARRHARRRVDRRAAGGPGEALEHLRRVRPAGRDRRPSTARSTCSTSRSGARSTASRRPRSQARPRSLTEVEGWKLGLTICYDLRFPELYRVLALEGAEVVTVPGRVHALHRQGPLGAPAPGPGGGEPVLRRRREPVGLASRTARRPTGAR